MANTLTVHTTHSFACMHVFYLLSRTIHVTKHCYTKLEHIAYAHGLSSRETIWKIEMILTELIMNRNVVLFWRAFSFRCIMHNELLNALKYRKQETGKNSAEEQRMRCRRRRWHQAKQSKRVSKCRRHMHCICSVHHTVYNCSCHKFRFLHSSNAFNTVNSFSSCFWFFFLWSFFVVIVVLFFLSFSIACSTLFLLDFKYNHIIVIQ